MGQSPTLQGSSSSGLWSLAARQCTAHALPGCATQLCPIPSPKADTPSTLAGASPHTAPGYLPPTAPPLSSSSPGCGVGGAPSYVWPYRVACRPPPPSFQGRLGAVEESGQWAPSPHWSQAIAWAALGVGWCRQAMNGDGAWRRMQGAGSALLSQQQEEGGRGRTRNRGHETHLNMPLKAPAAGCSRPCPSGTVRPGGAWTSRCSQNPFLPSPTRPKTPRVGLVQGLKSASTCKGAPGLRAF